jgi:nitrate reductase gamma subunit
MTDLFLFAVLPYVCVAIAAVGFAWRATPAGRRAITTRSSQFLEGRALFWGSVPWHYAVLLLLSAHVLAALFPGAWGALLGESTRLAIAEMSGLALGLWAFVACAVLLVRRAASRRLRVVTSPMDWVVLGLLLLLVASGVVVAATLRWGSVWYLHTAVPWLRSLARLDPQIEFAALLPAVVKTHALTALVLLAIAPFSRLVHVVAAPLHYLWRPPQVVRWNRPRPTSKAA